MLANRLTLGVCQGLGVLAMSIGGAAAKPPESFYPPNSRRLNPLQPRYRRRSRLFRPR